MSILVNSELLFRPISDIERETAKCGCLPSSFLNLSALGSMCVKLIGFLSTDSSATSSTSNRKALGMRGPLRYSAKAERGELGICHVASRGKVVCWNVNRGMVSAE